MEGTTVPEQMRYRKFVALGSGPEERFEHWRTWHADAVGVPVRLEPAGPLPRDFAATAEVLGVGDLRVVELRCGPALGTWRHGEAGGDGSLRVVVFTRAPAATAYWHGRVVEVADGTAALLGRTDGWCSAPAGLHAIQLTVPRQAVPLTDAALDRITHGHVLGESLVFEVFVRPMLAGMAGRLREFAGAATADLSTTWRALVTMLLRSLDGDGLAAEELLPAKRREVRRFIETHLADPDLGPDKIASALGMSRRSLYQLMSDDGEGIAATIRHQRLRCAHRLLTDPGRRDRSVAEIAAAVGLRHAAHFSRLFRAEYGRTPREVRRVCPRRTPRRLDQRS